MTVYVSEEYTPAEADVLRRYFTNLDGPVFALVNLPEVVKGALFARYSRSPKSLRRLFLDEFVGDLDIAGDASIDATVGLQRAEELYDRVFFEYGDDSVAQLGGVHLACEQASNLLTKVLEWGRLDVVPRAEHPLHRLRRPARRPLPVLPRPRGARAARWVCGTSATSTACSTRTPSMAATMPDYFRERFPKDPGDSDFVYRRRSRPRRSTPCAGSCRPPSLSNVGIYGTGQAYEALLLRMRAHPLPEARSYADLMLTELRKVIPSFLKRVDLTDRGVAASTYLATTRASMEDIADKLFPDGAAGRRAGRASSWSSSTPTPRCASSPPCSTRTPTSPSRRSRPRSGRCPSHERVAIVRAYVGKRTNRRHRPGRAFERPMYRFDVLADYGAFRDLQRHRMLTVEWQPLSPRPRVHAPRGGRRRRVRRRASTRRWGGRRALHDALAERFPAQAPYAVALAYRLRFSMQMNAREAMHLIELRSAPQGHAAYRSVAQEMHRLIAEKAGHHAVAGRHALRRPLARAAARAPRQRASGRAAPHVSVRLGVRSAPPPRVCSVSHRVGAPIWLP